MLLIVEVADTTLRYDREIKIPLYARHGIPEVWLTDVEGRTLTVFETPTDGRYRNERRVRPSGALAPKALPGVEVDLSRLFGKIRKEVSPLRRGRFRGVKRAVSA
ncbi:MAG: Uma2 family endonuclease [Gammaproteobacteria bacterium]